MRLLRSGWRVVCGLALSALCATLVFRNAHSTEPPQEALDPSAAAKIELAARSEVAVVVQTTSRLTDPRRISTPRLDDAAFDVAWKEEPRRLGAVAAGRPNRGFLYNGTPLTNDGVYFRLEEPENSYGTAETIAGLVAAVAEVHRLHPGTRPLSVGHISRAGGGWLRPHKSHQNGRDVDLGFYYSDDAPWYRRATEENLDVARTWSLITAMERAAGLEYVFVDRSLHAVLRRHAEAIGEPQEFIEYMFDGPMPSRGPTIRHARGHLTHLHVRFASPVAVENATRVTRRLGKAGQNSGQLVQLLQQQNNRGARVKGVKRAQFKSPAFKSPAKARPVRRTGQAHVKAL